MTPQQWHTENPLNCPIVATLSLIGGKWKPVLLHRLQAGTVRFGELRRSVTGISQKILTEQLRELEQDGLLTREIYPEVPPRVEYTLTAKGCSLAPLLDALYHWGEHHTVRPPEGV